MSFNQPGSGLQNVVNTAQGLIGGGQPAQQLSGNQGLLNTAQGLIGGGQPTQQLAGNQGLLNTAQGLIGGGQPINQAGGINKVIDTAQGFLGHPGQGGPGIHGAIDKAQGFIGGNTAQSGTALQGNLGQGTGLINTAQGLIGGGQPINQAGGINRVIDTAQGFVGHTGQGGTGIHGAIDKAQGFIGGNIPQQGVPLQGNQSQGTGLINTAQNLIGGGQRAQPMGQAGGINRVVDTAQGLVGHTGQGGTGIHGVIDKAQGFLGNSGHA